MNKKRKFQPRFKADAAYKQISSELAEKSRKTQKEGSRIVQEMYVDSQRGISVQLGGEETDLKAAMDKSGLCTSVNAERLAGQPSDDMYLKQAEHLMRKGVLVPALAYIDQAMKMNPESKHVQAAHAKCHLLMGNWDLARRAADRVLEVDKNFVKAIYAKAESLYNTCNFEHALIFYHRGQRLSPDLEEFRLGVQKCRKTIRDGVKNELVFEGHGVETVFYILRKAADMRTGDNLYTSQKQTLEVNENSVKLAIKCMVKVTSEKKQKTSKTLQHLPAASLSSKSTDIQEPGKKKTAKKLPYSMSVETASTSEVAPACPRRRGVGGDIAEKIRIVRRRCNQKVQLALSEDRLLEDKMYLRALAFGIEGKPGSEIDMVKQDISDTAEEALVFLRAREEFWNQLKLGGSGAIALPRKHSKTNKSKSRQ